MDRYSSKAVMRVYNGGQKLSESSLVKLFLKQLDSVYCIKKHLLTVLPSMADKASFPDLKAAILDSADQIKIQLLRIDVIYKMYNAEYTDDRCIGIKTLSLEAYMATRVEDQQAVERDLSLLIHLQIIESVEMAYFEVLKRLASSLNNKEVDVLLSQNFETATRSKHLYELIAKEYIS
jgi:ferritin-like metal-binding protein YciE